MSTTARLRADIDAGLSGSKVAGSDPAAAPLGTDDEAAGTPPTSAAVDMARAAELGGAADQRDKGRASALLYMLIIATVILLLSGSFLYFAGLR
jgi:hypothetical protein